MKKITFTIVFIITSRILFSQTAINTTININPNPFARHTLASYTLTTHDTISIYIMNSLGQNVLTVRQSYPVNAGSYQDSLFMDAFPNGIYFLQFTSGRGLRGASKLIKSGTVSITTISLDDGLSVYPNPFHDKLTVNTFDAQELQLTLLTVLGQTIYTGTTRQKNEFDFGFLPAGLYYLHLQNGIIQKRVTLIKE